MSSASLPSSVQSIPLTFKVGSEGTVFYVHSDLVAAQSPPLQKLVEEHTKEQKHSSVRWKDVDEAVFGRFVSYIYTGDYKEAKVIQRHYVVEFTDRNRGQEESTVSVTLSLSEDSSWGQHAQHQPVKRQRNRKRPWNQFLELHPEPTQPDEFIDPRDDHTLRLLSNAEMYVFAQKHDIESLQKLALRKLRVALEEVFLDEFHDDAIRDITQLAEYVYNFMNIPPDDQDPLRHLIALYAACKIDILWTGEKFKELAEGNGSLSKDLITQMLGRL